MVNSTWDDVFSGLGPVMLDESREDALADQLNDWARGEYLLDISRAPSFCGLVWMGTSQWMWSRQARRLGLDAARARGRAGELAGAVFRARRAYVR